MQRSHLSRPRVLQGNQHARRESLAAQEAGSKFFTGALQCSSVMTLSHGFLNHRRMPMARSTYVG
jgi:hypothetical protein